MNDVNEQHTEDRAPQTSVEPHWIERLTDAASDFEALGAEDAAGLGW